MKLSSVRSTSKELPDGPFGADMSCPSASASAAGPTTSTDWRVYMYGLVPGFCYLGRLPEFPMSRRATVRPPHPPGAVIVADGMCVVTTVSMPTGWWLIGRTPEHLFLPAREPTFLVGVGDTVRFEPIDRATFDALDARSAAGEIVARKHVTA